MPPPASPPRGSGDPCKSMKKRAEKPLLGDRFGVVIGPLMRYMILKPELTGFPFV